MPDSCGGLHAHDAVAVVNQSEPESLNQNPRLRSVVYGKTSGHGVVGCYCRGSQAFHAEHVICDHKCRVLFRKRATYAVMR